MKKILLVVDDESIVYKALSTQFTEEEITIVAATDGESGLKTALELHPDLILLDLVMPKMDGLTMLTKLREDDWGKQANVIVLTNIGEEEKEKEVAEKGIDAYLVKTNWNVLDVAKMVKDILYLETNKQ